MRVLLVNDDGGPNDLASPYVKYLVEAIEKHTNWDLKIVVPISQKSWIGKAHFAGRDVTVKYIYSSIEHPEDNSYHGPFGLPQEKLRANKALKEWCLVDDGTPATCADIGINHIMRQDNVDLVLSGPNVGRNSTSLYALSSGTIGGAMEGCSHGKKAIALSFAYEKRFDTDPEILKQAALISVKTVEKLYSSWADGVDLYTINIPLIADLKFGKTRIFKTPMLRNRWKKSLFSESSRKLEDSDSRHLDIVDESVSAGQLYKWSPDFELVHKDVAASTEFTDGKAISQGYVSVTALKTAFAQVDKENTGEIHLDLSLSSLSLDDKHGPIVVITYPEDSYLNGPLRNAVDKYLTGATILSSLKDAPKDEKVFQYGEYEDLDHERLFSDKLYLANSYTYRKGLIRKQYFANAIAYYVAKHPESILKTAYPETFQLECAYADFLDDSLDEAFELRCTLEQNTSDTFILKPSLSDRGDGIRLFKNIEQLQAIFDSFEEEEEEAEEDGDHNAESSKHGIILSQMRNFIVQKYMSNPLLLKEYGNRKFHIRTYVLCVGNLTVYVYQRMLMLFSETPYEKPSNDTGKPIDIAGHLTNTCLQDDTDKTVVVEFGKSSLGKFSKEKILNQINLITAEVFKSALEADRINFQPLGNAFETYGLDFLVDSDLNVQILEVNAYPDFKQTGSQLKSLIYELFEGTFAKAVLPFYSGSSKEAENLKTVLSIKDGFC